MSPESEIEEYNSINGIAAKFQLNPGDLLLFRSHVDHESERSISEVDRVCIAFNYTLHGKWGASTTSISLP